MPPTSSTLKRELGRWDLTAIGINMVIGAGVFLVPSEVAAQVGRWGPAVYLALGFFSLLVGLCFAEVGSRFEGTGGPYLYTQAAFGRFAAFEVGWMYWFTRVAAQASVTNGLILALGFYWPWMRMGMSRLLLLTVVTAAFATINVWGVRQAARMVDFFTIGKLLPLLLFIGVGIFFIRPQYLVPAGPVPWSHLPAAMLVLLFIFSGYEVIAVPAGESKNPRRHVPFAVVATILAVTAVNTLVHIVAMGTLVTLASSVTPLADAALLFMGAAGALMMGLGSVVSIMGNTAGQILTSSRMLFALAENGDLPAFFGKIHRTFRTPANAIIFSSAAALILALSGSFEELAAASAMARLLVYLSVCGSTLILRRRKFDHDLDPPGFRLPFGPLIPSLALVFSASMLLGVGKEEFIVGMAALLLGAILFLISTRILQRKNSLPAAPGAPETR